MTNEEIRQKQEAKAKNYETFKNYFNYGIVAIVSLLVLIVAPALESAITGKLTYPTTVQGWIFWSVGRIAVTVINIIIFTALDNQSEVNAKDNENYQMAKKLLTDNEAEQKKALSPEQLKKRTYLKKIPSIIIGSALSLVALSQIIFNYSLATLVSYIFTVVMDIAFGVWHMIDKEINYWSDEYLRYAIQKAEEQQKLKTLLEAQNKAVEPKIEENQANPQEEQIEAKMEENNGNNNQ